VLAAVCPARRAAKLQVLRVIATTCTTGRWATGEQM
jgi:hypothetical protein